MAKSNYKYGLGWNLAEGALTKFNPQPRSIGVKVTRRSFHSNGVYDEGLYVELLWSALENEVDYQNILIGFDLLNVDSNLVTIYCRDQFFRYKRYNGMVYRPLIGEDVDWNFFPENLVLTIRDLILIG